MPGPLILSSFRFLFVSRLILGLPEGHKVVTIIPDAQT